MLAHELWTMQASAIFFRGLCGSAARVVDYELCYVISLKRNLLLLFTHGTGAIEPDSYTNAYFLCILIQYYSAEAA